MERKHVLIGGGLLIATALMLWRPVDTYKAPLSNQPAEKNPAQLIYGATIPGAHFDYNFSGKLPKGWKVEAVPEIEALNLYDPNASGDNNLDKSQIFIRKFKASSFQTLTTVNILKREELTISERAAVRYSIEKKSEVPDFPDQPQWRNYLHTVTDVRVSGASPSLFYVVSKNPVVSENVYQNFLSSLDFDLSPEEIGWVSPIDEFKQRITKKPFGILIDPETSPVQPEKFSGYHTAVDVEYEDVEAAISVRAIGNGRVVVSRTAQGYGGVLVVQHPYLPNFYTLYGHIDPSSLPRTGTVVSAGEIIAKLAPGYSAGSGGERKHLHFGVIRKSSPDIAGYVVTKEQLSGWLDPLALFPTP